VKREAELYCRRLKPDASRITIKDIKHKRFPMKRIALFPGTFDPITIGHMDIIQRAIPLFDKLIIGIGRNANKAAMFSEELRLQWVNEIFKNEPQVSAIIYGANFIIRGIRYVNDFEYEKAIADMNRSLDPEIETVFLTCLPQYTSVASTLVRDVIRNGGNASPFLPEVVADALSKQPVKK
jgi:pantetheine-phosphate adenylyltransferase